MEKRKLVRAVIRRVDAPTKTTEWVPSDSLALREMLIEILPPSGQAFLVVWEERESFSNVASA